MTQPYTIRLTDDQHDALTQHGTIPLRDALTQIAQIAATPPPPTTNSRTITVTITIND